MAAASSDQATFLRSTIQFMHAVRHGRTEQAKTLLEYHSADKRSSIIFYSTPLFPSASKTIRDAVALLREQQAATIAYIELIIILYNTVIDSYPLLQAKEEGDISKVKTLLKQLPKEETVRLITHGPDNESMDTEALQEDMCEKAINAIRNTFLDHEEAIARIANAMPKFAHKIIKLVGGNAQSVSRWTFAILGDSDLVMIKLLLDHVTNSNDLNDLFSANPDSTMLGLHIASTEPEKSLIFAQTLLSKIPDSLKPPTCLYWAMICVSGGVCGEKVITLLLRYIKYDSVVENKIIGMLINILASSKEQGLIKAFLDIVPPENLASVLTRHFEIDNSNGKWEDFFSESSGFVLGVAHKNGHISLIRKLLSSEQILGLSNHIKSSTRVVKTEMLALCQEELRDYCIPDDPDAQLKMHGVVCFNDFKGHADLQREGAAAEANAMAHSLVGCGVKIQPDIENWTTYSLFQSLKEFCREIKNNCSFVVVCIMTHGKSGKLYACHGQRDSCEINDILDILGKELHDHVPKMLVIQACQGLVGLGDGGQSGSHLRASSSVDAAIETDASRAKPSTDDFTNVHIEIKIPNTTLLMSTLYGSDSYRNHFIPALAAEIRKADGVRTVYDMFIAASHNMTQHPEEKYQRQNPEHRTSNRKNLIIPKKRAQIQKCLMM